MSYEDDLLNDLENSGSESEVETHEDGNTDLNLEQLVNNSIPLEDQLNLLDITNILDPTTHLQMSKLSGLILDKISKFTNEESDYLKLISNSDFENDEYKFLIQINKLIGMINYEMTFLFTFIKFKYKVVFPELESIVTNPEHYIKIITLVKQDLIGIRDYEEQLKTILSNDKILVIIMSGLQASKTQFTLSDDDFDMILIACKEYNNLSSLLASLSNFIQEKLIKFTPNLTNLVGSVTSAQILIHAGSLNQLCLIPSCNLPSLGVKELSSTTKKINASIQRGYLYHSDLIKYLPPDVTKSALRILSGKVILAARVDMSKSSPNGEIGMKYREEVSEKISKLLTPPDASGVKALPKPTDYKSKRRGGKKIRKMKQKFQMSQLAKAQNKLNFGAVEDSYIDSFGNEIGMGLTRDPNVKVNNNTKASMSKGMKSRLTNDTNEKKRHLDSIFDDDFSSIIKKPKSISTSSTDSKWIDGNMKK